MDRVNLEQRLSQNLFGGGIGPSTAKAKAVIITDAGSCSQLQREFNSYLQFTSMPSNAEVRSTEMLNCKIITANALRIHNL